MDNRAEIREFLATRRAKITPQQAGLQPGGGRRRVPGLRREEVAVLAGVSTEWYVRLEKGHISGVSAEVLDAVARALQLDEAERLHLSDLARAAKPSRSPRRRTQQTVRPSVLRILDSMTSTPAFVRNGRLDVLAINPLGRALYSPAFDDPVLAGPGRPANLARFCFLGPASRDFSRHRPARSLADHPPKEAQRGTRPSASAAVLTATEELSAPAAALSPDARAPREAAAQEHPPACRPGSPRGGHRAGLVSAARRRGGGR